jgi:cell division GTPase FtsZ
MTEAISSPLIANVEKLKTRRLLYIVYSGKKGPAKMDELDELCEFMEYFDEDILLGHYMDDSLEDEIKVSVVATGFDQTVSVAGKGSDVSDEQRQLQLLREQYYGKAKRPLKHREETLTGAAESESDDIVAEDAEKEAISSNRPNKKRSFMRGLVEKMKVLMEEEC